MTEPEKETVADLWEKYEELNHEIRNLEYEVQEMCHAIDESRCEARAILRLIEDIQGEIDWG